ncbi:M15 family metallopeptidase [Nocardioides dongxiaopingii]|uniref:M15 family metallopeptidase n=1 Tax=Nocardioides sp. S-1144 TaxID=2582905 RepID=UPI00110DDE52|nr:M15 family metallopeptidase [Nocardioides sp. S-1144]QCW50245.1 M15 family metallopeptidase [Nocardioides sp. S-1144]
MTRATTSPAPPPRRAASDAAGSSTTILLSDPRVGAVPVHDTGEPLVRLPEALSPVRALVRAGLAGRLTAAAAALPAGVGLKVVEGHRTVAEQRAIIATYAADLCARHPGISATDLHVLTSRFVAPVDVAPHVAGAAVDVTLVDACGDELDLGTPIDATPEQSEGRCYLDADGIGADARAHRDLLALVLRGAGLVNYPTEWWHWSYGDRYWALLTGAPHALHGPVEIAVAA